MNIFFGGGSNPIVRILSVCEYVMIERRYPVIIIFGEKGVLPKFGAYVPGPILELPLLLAVLPHSYHTYNHVFTRLLYRPTAVCQSSYMIKNKNLAIANRPRVSCAHNSSRASP